MSTINSILNARAALRNYGAEPREIRVSHATYQKLRAELEACATFVSMDQAQQAALGFNSFEGMKVVIDDRVADDMAELK